MKKLRHSSIQVSYSGEDLNTPAHWVYYPSPDISYHRILVRKNFLPGARGYWTETNASRSGQYAGGKTGFSCLNEYAYPLNTIEKPKIMTALLAHARAKGVFGLGRWGEHCHYNSDLVVERAMELAERLR